MKKVLRYIFPTLLFLSFISCKKFLDVQPIDAVSDEQTIVDKASAETALRGVYRGLSADNYYGLNFTSIGYLSGDNVQWTGSQSIVQQFIDHNVRADNATVDAVWTAIYATINRANHVIEKVPAVVDPSFTDAYKNQLVGEAYFIRALAYFDLVRTWGGVQLILTPTVKASDHNGTKRSSVDETYAQVLSDLNSAENLLQVPTSPNPYRANKETVWALRARYYLYRQEWEAAETDASQVIDDNINYSLLYPYSSFFTNGVVGTRESVFELSYSATYTNGHRNQWQPPANGGTRQWAPNNAFVALVNDTTVGGNRKSLIAQTSQGLWYGNLYYRSPATDPAYIIRIAELYLIRAEARAQQNKLNDALDDLNAIRQRAGLDPSSATTKEGILLAIELERRIEFALEGHRWYDLVRTGRAAEVLGVTDPNKYLLPIPAAELNTDPSLDPNPGY